jgi:hypothetical protein
MTRFICQYCKEIFSEQYQLKHHYLIKHLPNLQEKAKAFNKSEDWVAGTMAWDSSTTIEA